MLPLTSRQCPREPIQPLVEAITSGRASSLHVPRSVSKALQAQLLRQLRGCHRVRQILLIGQDEEGSVSKLVFF